MPVSATVVRDALMTASVALLDMAADSRRSTDLDRRHYTALCRRQRSIVLLTIGVTVAAEHIRHFRPRPSHWLGRSGGRWRFRFGVDGKSRQQIHWTGCRAHRAGGDPKVTRCRVQATVPEQSRAIVRILLCY
jgi:hypothetical protein